MDLKAVNKTSRRQLKPKLRKRLGVWVYEGRPSSLSIPAFIDKQREKRLLELA